MDRALGGQCSHSIEVLRTCGHTIDVPFNTIFKRRLPPCEKLVQRMLVCGHAVEVPCHSDEVPRCNAPVSDVFTYSCGVHTVQPGTCHRLSALRAQSDAKCVAPVECPRYRCQHIEIAPCHLQPQIQTFVPSQRLASGTPVVGGEEYGHDTNAAGTCKQPVAFRATCGHERRDIPCHKPSIGHRVPKLYRHARRLSRSSALSVSMSSTCPVG